MPNAISNTEMNISRSENWNFIAASYLSGSESRHLFEQLQHGPRVVGQSSRYGGRSLQGRGNAAAVVVREP